jgi:WD40 repeat protein
VVSGELAALVGLALFGLVWLSNVDSDRRPARMRLARGDGGRRSQTMSFALSPDGTTIATIHEDGRVALRSGTEGASLPRVLGYHGGACAVAFSPDSQVLAIGGKAPDVMLCGVRTGGAERPLNIQTRETNALAFSPDGRTLAATSFLSHEIILWDMAGGRERARLRGHASYVSSIAFAPDGRFLASGGVTDRSIIIWDLATGAPKVRLAGPSGPIAALAYSPDGSLLASASGFESSVRLWDLTSGRLKYLIGSYAPAANSVAFAPDGRLLATADHDGTVKLWNFATGRLLAGLDGGSDWIGGVAFSSNGRTSAAIGNDTDVRLWDVTEAVGSQINHQAEAFPPSKCLTRPASPGRSVCAPGAVTVKVLSRPRN